MTDIIHLLPDSIANQIAAGEVIQRPSSVVKELVENSIDAGAEHIQIYIKGAGRTLISVIDDGKGMSATDIRMAFERHATSKIKSADDLFALTTMGFRGEALPSIAAISQVEVKSRREEDELGSLLIISGSRLEKQEVISCGRGTSISVKNIFYNVPARRKFLKSNETERRNIFNEIERIALVHPDIEFSLIENDIETLHLAKAVLKQRIAQLEGKNILQQLIEIEAETTLGKIYGYVSRPEYAKKRNSSQFFFVNNRYIRHPYFHKAVMTAFEQLISPDEKPSYYIYLEVDPESLDVNIHPTKTEVKFENEQALWQILMVTVKESLGKFNAVPTIDFDREDAPEIPVYDPSVRTQMPRVNIDPSYNPFNSPSLESDRVSAPAFGWEKLHRSFEEEVLPSENSLISSAQNIPETDLYPEHYQYKQKYILTSVKSGLMIIDQHKAHVRILFEKYLVQIRNRKGVSQRVLFPEVLELTASESAALPSIMDDLEALGFELSNLGNNCFAIQGVPSEIENTNPGQIIKSMINYSLETGSDVKSEIQESIALSLARLTAIPYGRALSGEEMLLIVSQLFATPSPSYTPDGQKIISLLSDAEIEKKMN
ncbi:MAG: DNA mismatch repair endonuclease MutL [Fermentimonas sp.]|nr:DNA mismatch repair endonuclease MutL [Fermentimonas sp.]